MAKGDRIQVSDRNVRKLQEILGEEDALRFLLDYITDRKKKLSVQRREWWKAIGEEHDLDYKKTVYLWDGISEEIVEGGKTMTTGEEDD